MESREPAKRITTSIALAAIGLALGILFLGLTYVVPFMGIFISVFIPFVSALVALKGDWKAQLIYLGGALCICFIDMQEGFFDFLPNCLIGICFGDAVKKFSLSFFSYLIMVTASFLIEWALIFPIKWIWGTDMISVYAALFHKTASSFAILFPLFTLILSSVQSLVTFIIISQEVKKVSYVPPVEVKAQVWWYLAADALTLALIAVSYFFYLPLYYVYLGYLLIEASGQTAISFRLDKTLPVTLYVTGIIASLVIGGLIIGLGGSQYASLAFLPLGFIFVSISLVMLKYNVSANHAPEVKEEPKDLTKLKQNRNKK
jgi:hypothetical protein